MQQLHHASLKALKRRREAGHAAAAVRRASLTLDAEDIAGDATRDTVPPPPLRGHHRRHSLGSSDLDMLLASPRAGRANST